MTEVDPNASTACKCLTKQFFFAILFAVTDKTMVKVTAKPSGTFATTIPAKKIW
jgi:hypothetical protein